MNRLDVGPRLDLTYTNHRGDTASRTVSPVNIWFGVTEWHPKGGWLMKCWDWDKHAERDYLLSKCNFTKKE